MRFRAAFAAAVLLFLVPSGVRAQTVSADVLQKMERSLALVMCATSFASEPPRVLTAAVIASDDRQSYLITAPDALCAPAGALTVRFQIAPEEAYPARRVSMREWIGTETAPANNVIIIAVQRGSVPVATLGNDNDTQSGQPLLVSYPPGIFSIRHPRLNVVSTPQTGVTGTSSIVAPVGISFGGLLFDASGAILGIVEGGTGFLPVYSSQPPPTSTYLTVSARDITRMLRFAAEDIIIPGTAGAAPEDLLALRAVRDGMFPLIIRRDRTLPVGKKYHAYEWIGSASAVGTRNDELLLAAPNHNDYGAIPMLPIDKEENLFVEVRGADGATRLQPVTIVTHDSAFIVFSASGVKAPLLHFARTHTNALLSARYAQCDWSDLELNGVLACPLRVTRLSVQSDVVHLGLEAKVGEADDGLPVIDRTSGKIVGIEYYPTSTFSEPLMLTSEAFLRALARLPSSGALHFVGSS